MSKRPVDRLAFTVCLLPACSGGILSTIGALSISFASCEGSVDSVRGWYDVTVGIAPEVAVC
ncbi:hypothetical protein KCP77_07020 [Salmonella enterica subsp. enterica]|nr:hypothetical protein KCP77_07020 [Salmonella enterica subsp. enterica]